MRRFVFACLIAACAALAPTWASADDQQIVQFIQQQLVAAQEEGTLKGFDLNLHVEQGTVWFSGTVASQQQKDLVLSAAKAGQSKGVTQIVDDITVTAPASTPAVTTPAVSTPAAASSRRGAAPAPVQDRQIQTVQHQQPVHSAAQRPAPRASTPLAAAPASYNQGPMMGPPMAQGMGAPNYMPASSGQPAGAYYDQPNVPGYAWPSYAAHPNYSAVAYPTQYSPTAWPYIGPFYPYPQVPLGWRKVTLEWDDGWWYLDFHQR